MENESSGCKVIQRCLGVIWLSEKSEDMANGIKKTVTDIIEKEFSNTL